MSLYSFGKQCCACDAFTASKCDHLYKTPMRQYFLSQRDATQLSAGARQARFVHLRAELTLQDNQITEGWKKGGQQLESKCSWGPETVEYCMKPKLWFTPSSSSGYVTAARETIRVLQEADRYQRSSNICISLEFNPNTRRSTTLRRSSANSLVQINTPVVQTLPPLITESKKMVYRLTSVKKYAFMNQLWIPHKLFSIPREEKVWLCSRSALCVAAGHWRPAESFGLLS